MSAQLIIIIKFSFCISIYSFEILLISSQYVITTCSSLFDPAAAPASPSLSHSIHNRHFNYVRVRCVYSLLHAGKWEVVNFSRSVFVATDIQASAQQQSAIVQWARKCRSSAGSWLSCCGCGTLHQHNTTLTPLWWLPTPRVVTYRVNTNRMRWRWRWWLWLFLYEIVSC